MRWRWSALGIGGTLVIAMVLVALLAPVLAPKGSELQRLERRLETPSVEHPLGLDELGRDILARLLRGAALRAAGPKAEAARANDGSDFTFEIHGTVLMQVTAPRPPWAVTSP